MYRKKHKCCSFSRDTLELILVTDRLLNAVNHTTCFFSFFFFSPLFLLGCAVTGLNSRPEAFFVFSGWFASTALSAHARPKTNFCEFSSVFSKRVIDFRQTVSSEGSSVKCKHPVKKKELMKPP